MLPPTNAKDGFRGKDRWPSAADSLDHLRVWLEAVVRERQIDLTDESYLTSEHQTGQKWRVVHMMILKIVKTLVRNFRWRLPIN